MGGGWSNHCKANCLRSEDIREEYADPGQASQSEHYSANPDDVVDRQQEVPLAGQVAADLDTFVREQSKASTPGGHLEESGHVFKVCEAKGVDNSAVALALAGTASPRESCSGALPVRDASKDGCGRTESQALRDSVVGRRLLQCRRIVHAEMTVKGVFKLDTVEQVFGVHLGVIMQWLCPDDEQPPTPAEDDGDWVPNWTPKYTISSEMQEHTSEEMYMVVHGEDGSRWIRMEASHLVDIYEELELHSFPNDIQDLNIELKSKSTIQREIWVPPSGKASCARLEKGKCYLQDFDIIKELPYTFACAPRERMPGGHKGACAIMTLKTKRKAGYYMLNMNLFVFLTCAFSLLTWSMHPADIGARHDTDFMIVLTMVSLFAGKSLMMPPLSYITTLDAYMMINLACVTLVTVSHMAIPLAVLGLGDVSPLTMPPLSFPDEQRLIDADTLSFWCFLIFMVAFNVAFAAYVYRRNVRELRLYLQQSREQQVKDIEAAQAFLASINVTDLPACPPMDAPVKQSHSTPKSQRTNSEGQPRPQSLPG